MQQQDWPCSHLNNGEFAPAGLPRYPRRDVKYTAFHCVLIEPTMCACSNNIDTQLLFFPRFLHNVLHFTWYLYICVDFCSNGEVRLIGPSSAFAGRVEICIGSMWTTLCGDFWDSQDASVLCSQLGYSPYGMLIAHE